MVFLFRSSYMIAFPVKEGGGGSNGLVIPFLVELVDEAIFVFGAGGAAGAMVDRGELVVASAMREETSAGRGESYEDVLGMRRRFSGGVPSRFGGCG